MCCQCRAFKFESPIISDQAIRGATEPAIVRSAESDLQNRFPLHLVPLAGLWLHVATRRPVAGHWPIGDERGVEGDTCSDQFVDVGIVRGCQLTLFRCDDPAELAGCGDAATNFPPLGTVLGHREELHFRPFSPTLRVSSLMAFWKLRCKMRSNDSIPIHAQNLPISTALPACSHFLNSDSISRTFAPEMKSSPGSSFPALSSSLQTMLSAAHKAYRLA